MPELNAQDVRDLLPFERFTEKQLALAISLVRGWLLGATRLPALPAPLPDDLWADATELLLLFVDNPTSLAQRTVGPTSASWPMAPRRDAILRTVRERYSHGSGPRGTYPRPDPWPGDPPAGGGLVWL